MSPTPVCIAQWLPISPRLLQVDCPEDVASYIHRVGRTARYVSSALPPTLLRRIVRLALVSPTSIGYAIASLLLESWSVVMPAACLAGLTSRNM